MHVIYPRSETIGEYGTRSYMCKLASENNVGEGRGVVVHYTGMDGSVTFPAPTPTVGWVFTAVDLQQAS